MLNRKVFTCLALVLVVVFSGLPFVVPAYGATNVIGIIDSDVTWTAHGSPYTLTGPTAINKGVTLAIEPGVTVNLNDYYIQVNGTLNARGTSSNSITFNGGKLVFTSTSNGWNEQNNQGNIIDNAKLFNTEIASENALAVKNSEIIGDNFQVGTFSVISNNKIGYDSNAGYIDFVPYALWTGDSCKIEGNTISGMVFTGDNTAVTHNTLTGGNQKSSTDATELSTGQGCTISDNTITGVTNLPNSYVTQMEKAIHAGYSSVISNNKVYGTITGDPSEITGNSIRGGAKESSWDWRSTSASYAVDIDSTVCKFKSNSIEGLTGAAVSAQQASFDSNVISGSIKVDGASTFTSNIIEGSITGGNSFNKNIVDGSIYLSDSATIKGNHINGRISCNDFNCEISDNTISYGGISSAAGNIHNNLITSGSGITTNNAKATITANTISKNTVGITVGSIAPTITDNNIEDNTQNSIYLTNSGDVDASNNWWGTTDTQTISNTIHDSQSDFNLGKVNILPILTTRNQQALPDPNIDLPNATPIVNIEPTATPPPMEAPTTTPTTSSINDASKNGEDSYWSGAMSVPLLVAIILVLVAVIVVLVFVRVHGTSKA
jgi:hypothetical protein